MFGIEVTPFNILAVIGGVAGIVYFARSAILLVKILDALNQLTDIAPIVREIALQFRNDSGSTLKDQIDRLSNAAQEAKFAASLMKETIDNIRANQRADVTTNFGIGGDAVGASKTIAVTGKEIKETDK